MNIQNVTWEMVVGALALILCCLNGYNVWCTAVKNKHDREKASKEPTVSIQQQIDKHTELLAEHGRRIDTLEDRTKDLHEGQMVNCAGVQALLEHELHNGNTDEMQNASKNISKWLLKR